MILELSEIKVMRNIYTMKEDLHNSSKLFESMQSDKNLDSFLRFQEYQKIYQPIDPNNIINIHQKSIILIDYIQKRDQIYLGRVDFSLNFQDIESLIDILFPIKSQYWKQERDEIFHSICDVSQSFLQRSKSIFNSRDKFFNEKSLNNISMG